MRSEEPSSTHGAPVGWVHLPRALKLQFLLSNSLHFTAPECFYLLLPASAATPAPLHVYPAPARKAPRGLVVRDYSSGKTLRLAWGAPRCCKRREEGCGGWAGCGGYYPSTATSTWPCCGTSTGRGALSIQRQSHAAPDYPPPDLPSRSLVLACACPCTARR